MKKLLIILSFIFCAIFLQAQNNIVKGTGICYTNGVPTVTIDPDYYCEVAIDTTTGKIYVYARDTAGGKWIHYGWPLRETGTVGSPSYTPGDKQSYFAVNLGDSLYFYGGGSWGLVSGGGGGISSNVLSLSGNVMTSNINSGSYSDTSLVIGEVNGNLSGNTQTINVNDVTDTMAVIGSNVLTFTSDSIKSTINGINSNAIYLGGYTNTDTQDLSITAGKGTINLVDGGNVTLNDSSSTNEGIVSFTVSANTGTLLSNTFGQQPYYFGGRGILQLTDSSGYTLLTATEGDGSTTNEGLLSWNVSANLMTLTSNTSGSETLLAAGRSGITLTDSSGYLIFTGSAAGSTDTTYFHHQYGNSYGKVSTIGTNDNYGVNIETNNINRVHIDTSGVMSVGTTTPVAIGNATMTPAADYTFGNGAYGLTLNSTKNSASAILINTTGQDANSTCFGMSNFTSTTINKAVVNFMDTVTVASGTIFFDAIEINNVFNVTGGSAIGSFTGLHINPSFTSLAGLSSTYYGVYIPYTNANAKGIWQTGALTENLFAGQTQFSKQIKSKEISAPSTPPSTFGYWYVSSSDSKPHFITDGGTDYDLTAGGGVSTNTLSLSGNSMTSNVDGVSDTSLVIGEVYTNLSGNTLTTEVNNISDTSLIIGVHTVNLSGNQITSNTNGVSDTTLVIGTVNGNLASNTITLNVNSVTDTVLVIGRNTLNLSGNEITTNVNGVTDTTLVIGTVSNTSSTNSLSTTVNGITGSTVNIINSNTLSFGTVTGILTSNINGVSDTTLISAVVGDGDKGDITISSGVWDIDASTVGTSEITDGSIANGDLASGVGGIYKGSGDVAAGAYANTGSISSTDNFFLGSYHSQPTVNYDGREYGLQVYSGGNVGIAELNGADSIAATYSKLSLNGDVSLLASNVANTAQSYVSLFSAGYFEAGHTLSGNTGTIRIAGYDSTKIISKKLAITVDSFRLKIQGSYPTSGYTILGGSNGLAIWGQIGNAGIANNSVDGTKIAMGSDAQGDVLYYNGTDWARLAAGTSGYFLKTQGAGANPIWAAASGGSGDNIYNTSGIIDSTRSVQIHVDSVLAFGYMPTFPSYGLSGKERALYFDEDRRVALIGGDSLTSIYTMVQLSNAVSIYSSKSDLSDYSSAEFATTGIALRATDVGDSQDSYWYIKPDSLAGVSDKLFIDVDSFRLKILGAAGTSGQFVKVGANGLLTFGSGASLLATDTAYFHHQYGNSYGRNWIGGSNDNFGLQLKTNGVGRVYIDSLGLVGIGNAAPLVKLHIGDTSINNSVDCQVLLSRSVKGTVAGNGHGYSESSQINRGGTIGYNSFDARVNFNGSFNYDHNASFQALPSYGSSGTMTNCYGLYSGATVSAGTITNSYGSYSANPTGAGAVTNAYGFYSEAITKGATLNYAFYSAGSALSHFNGNVEIGTNPMTLSSTTITGLDGLTITGGDAVGDSIIYKPTTANGTDASGAHVFKGDNNGAKTLMTIRNNGYIGIGTTIPSQRLEVGAGGSGSTSEVLIINSGATGQAVTWYEQNSTVRGIFGLSNQNDGIISGSVIGDFCIRSSQKQLYSIDAGTTAALKITSGNNFAFSQLATATGALKGIVYTGAVNTNQTLSTEIPAVTFTTAGRQWATGALTTQREVLITQPTYSFVGASTITNAATVGIAGAPIKSTNATLTNTTGLWIQAGAVSTATNSYGLKVDAQTGATTNYTTAFSGGNFAATGDAQEAIINLRRAITGTAATELFLDGSSVQAVLPATNTGWVVQIDLIAICTAAGNGTTTVGETFNAKRYAAITRLNTTTALTGSVETLGTDKAGTSMSTSAITITADDTNEALKITFTPPSTAGSTTTFRVVATYKITQVQY